MRASKWLFCGFLICASSMISACGGDDSENTCRVDKCKDASTLLVCSQETSTYVEKACALGCENGACKKDTSEKCTQSTCKDDKVLLKCDVATGETIESVCEFGCEKNDCKSAPTSDKCTKDACKDNQTLLVCNPSTGTTTEQACEHGCIGNACVAGPTCTKDTCKDDQTLLVCNAALGTTTEKACEHGCKGDACVELPKCTQDVCQNAQTLLVCDKSTQVATASPCADDEVCTFGKCEKTTVEDLLPKDCDVEDAPVCIGDTMSVFCDDYDGEGVKPFIVHCLEGRRCVDGACQDVENAACVASSCQDLSTLLECKDGKREAVSCGTGKICMNDACVEAGDIAPCKSDTDCGATQMCYQNVCYEKSNMALNVGDPCKASTFQEYCKGDVEYKCGYDDTVETNDCKEYNGCSLYIKPAYPNKKPIRNATCRGTDAGLANCTSAGLVGYQCMNLPSEWISSYYSVSNACVVGTDGRMIYVAMRDEYNCEPSKCDISTGFCPGASQDCPDGQKCPGTSCLTEEAPICDGNALIYCAETSGDAIWTKLPCPSGYTCSEYDEQAMCLEQCTKVGEKSSACGSGIQVETVCTDVDGALLFVPNYDAATTCASGCKDTHVCK